MPQLSASRAVRELNERDRGEDEDDLAAREMEEEELREKGRAAIDTENLSFLLRLAEG